MCKLCDDGSENGHEPALAQSRTSGWLCRKTLMVVWSLFVIYFVIAAAGGGGMTSAIGAAFCGFMVARNMADVIAV